MDTMSIHSILRAMNFYFGTIVTKHPSFIQQILVQVRVRTLDYIVFHPDKLKKQIQRHICHDFRNFLFSNLIK